MGSSITAHGRLAADVNSVLGVEAEGGRTSGPTLAYGVYTISIKISCTLGSFRMDICSITLIRLQPMHCEPLANRRLNRAGRLPFIAGVGKIKSRKLSNYRLT